MQSDPFLDFHRTAESAGYPAMLIVSVFALALVVAPVMLLALTRAVWVLVIAVLSIFAALALLAGAFGAAVADSDEPPPESSGHDEPAPDGVAGQLDAVAHAELLEHVGAVAIDRLLADEELLGDLLARHALRDQLDDLELTRAERILGGRLATAGAVEVVASRAP